MRPTIFSGEVVETSTAYKDAPPIIIVKFKAGNGRNAEYKPVPAAPLNAYSYTIPLKGEHVILYKAIGFNASTTNAGGGIWYYGDVIPAKLNLFENAIVGTTSTSYKDNSKTSGEYVNNTGTPNQTKLKNTRIRRNIYRY